jgi:hypothetical protein
MFEEMIEIKRKTSSSEFRLEFGLTPGQTRRIGESETK